MSEQNIKIEFESECKSGKSSGGENKNEGLSVNGLELESLINLLSKSESKYSTITIKADNSILISEK